MSTFLFVLGVSAFLFAAILYTAVRVNRITDKMDRG